MEAREVLFLGEIHALPRFVMETLYEVMEDLVCIVTRAATKFDKTISQDGARILARASRGTPRFAKSLLARARDVARACHLTAADARSVLESASIDAQGLGPNHRRALEHLRNRPLGTARLAGLLGLTPKAFRTLLEPDLLWMGLVIPTARGLVAASCNR